MILNEKKKMPDTKIEYNTNKKEKIDPEKQNVLNSHFYCSENARVARDIILKMRAASGLIWHIILHPIFQCYESSTEFSLRIISS